VNDPMKLAIAVAAAGCVYLLSGKPKWVDDLLIRAYSVDHMVDRGTTPEEKERFEQAAAIASQTGLPVGWVFRLLELGGTLNQVAQASNQIIAVMKEMGPPVDSLPETLASYRDKVLSVVAAGFQKANQGQAA